LYFQLPYLPEETYFQQGGSSAVESTSQVILRSSDQRKIPASLSLFLKSEKIPALLYLGKGLEYRPFCDFRPISLAYRPWAQISNHGRAFTQALLLYMNTHTEIIPKSWHLPTGFFFCIGALHSKLNLGNPCWRDASYLMKHISNTIQHLKFLWAII